MKYLLWMVLFFSKLGFACCSSPLADVVYEAKIIGIEQEYESDGKFYVITLDKMKDHFGDGPSFFQTRISNHAVKKMYEINLIIGAKYLIALYNPGKYGKSYWLLPEKKWGKASPELHPYIGIFNLESSKAELVIDSLKSFENNDWTSDFKYININFWQKP